MYSAADYTDVITNAVRREVLNILPRRLPNDGPSQTKLQIFRSNAHIYLPSVEIRQKHSPKIVQLLFDIACEQDDKNQLFSITTKP